MYAPALHSRCDILKYAQEGGYPQACKFYNTVSVVMPTGFRHASFVTALILIACHQFALADSGIICEPSADSDYWICSNPADTEADPKIQSPLNAYDFIPAEFLTNEQRKTLKPGCTGLYLDPLADASLSNYQASELFVESDHSSMHDGERFLIEGNVQVKHGPRSISADSMTYQREDEEGKLEGNVIIRNPGILIRGDKAAFSTKSEKASFEGAEFIMHEQHLRGSAESIRQDAGQKIVLNEGSVTTCEPGNNIWRIEGEKITLDQANNRGTARNVSLRVADVPIIYLPWFSFPLGDERQTGMLIPAISSSEDGGLDIALPWYWNLAPNYDMTITPRLISGRGGMLETENRYMNSSFTSSLNLAYLASDDGGQDPDVDFLIENGDIDETQGRPHKGNNRWLIEAHQTGGLNSTTGWYSDVNFSKVSDIDYFRDVGNTSFAQSNETFINQLVKLGYISDHWHLQTLAQDRQILLRDINKPYHILPQINAMGSYRLGGGLQLGMQHELTRFSHDDQIRLNGSNILTGDRLYMDYRMKRAWRKSWGFIKPEVGYKYLGYELDNTNLGSGVSSSPSAAAGQASLDMGLAFERKGRNFLQTIEPRIFHFYREFSDQSGFYNVTDDGQNINFDTSLRTFTYGQLYRDTRFSGHDRLDDANRTTLGLSTRWYTDSNSLPFFDASLGKVFHHADKRVSLLGDNQGRQSSELAGDLNIALGPLSRFYAMGNYDTANDEMSRASVGVRYASKDQKLLFNVAWSWVRDFQQVETISRNIDQIDTSLVVPLNDQWELMSRFNYDFDAKQDLETFVGLEYNDCCYLIRVLARRWLDSNIATLVDDEDLRYDQGIFLEFHLKGLGGSGARVNAILNDSIPGYEIRERTLNK